MYAYVLLSHFAAVAAAERTSEGDCIRKLQEQDSSMEVLEKKLQECLVWIRDISGLRVDERTVMRLVNLGSENGHDLSVTSKPRTLADLDARTAELEAEKRRTSQTS